VPRVRGGTGERQRAGAADAVWRVEPIAMSDPTNKSEAELLGIMRADRLVQDRRRDAQAQRRGGYAAAATPVHASSAISSTVRGAFLRP
jgi:hypothetical protein